MPTPSKFTADARQAILEVKRVGGPDTLACAAGHITVPTLQRWIEKGKTAEEGRYRQFYEDYQEAKAHPKIRALGMMYSRVGDSDQMLWKYIERQIEGYAPPQPNAQVPMIQTGPVIIRFQLPDRPLLALHESGDVVDAEVVDEPDEPDSASSAQT